MLDISDAARRIARSHVGNPHRLATMFRRYDSARMNRVSLQEFAQVMINCDLGATRGEAMHLAQTLDRGDGSVDYNSFIHAISLCDVPSEGGGGENDDAGNRPGVSSASSPGSVASSTASGKKDKEAKKSGKPRQAFGNRSDAVPLAPSSPYIRRRPYAARVRCLVANTQNTRLCLLAISVEEMYGNRPLFILLV